MAGLRHLLHPIYRSLETTVHPLRYLFLEITQKCNLNCLHCGSDCGKSPLDNELKGAQWQDFIVALGKRFQGRDKPFLVITGGEPLLCESLDDILHTVRKSGFAFGIVSNGFALDGRAADRLIGYGMTSTTISLDGLERTHDWFRGRKGAFAGAHRAVSILAQRNVRLFDVVTCVHPKALPELPDMLSLLIQSGVRRWRLFNVFAKGRAASNPEVILSDAQSVEMLHWIRDTRKRLAGSGFHLDFSCEGYLPKTLDRQVRDEPYFCRAGIAIGSVLADGAISACPNISRDLVQGNIRTDDFIEVWEKRFEPFRRRDWMRHGACAECPEWRRCKGNSLHLFDKDAGGTLRCYVASSAKSISSDD